MARSGGADIAAAGPDAPPAADAGPDAPPLAAGGPDARGHRPRWRAARERLHRLLARGSLARGSLVHGSLVMVPLCTAIALLLALLDGEPGAKLVYSFSIGYACWGLIDGGERLIALGLRRWQGRRGLAEPTPHRIGWAVRLPLVLVGVTLGPAIGFVVSGALLGRPGGSLWALGPRSLMITLFLTALGTLIAMVVFTARERLAGAQARAEAAQRNAAEAELRLLQSQLEPHMLFNTLANLRVLIGLDPARAQAMLDRLIGFLRATLAASRVPLHPLAAEFARVDDYLALMAVRMGPRLQARLSLPPALRDCPVPPLLLQPLVENAIRHGLEPAVDGGSVAVEARREGDRLVLSVCDTGVGLGASPHGDGTHFGLQQVRDRLRTLHGDRASVALGPAPQGDGTLATLTLPWPTIDAAGRPAHADAAVADATAAAGAAARPTDLRGPR